jgi:hypothetical protein
MIPLGYFVIAWLIFLAIYALVSFFSIAQMMRLGVSGFGTYASTILFLFVIVIAVLGVSSTVLPIDWSAPVHVFDWIDLSTSSLLPQ